MLTNVNLDQHIGPNLVGALTDPVSAPSPSERVKVGLSMRFLVEVGGLSLGHWQSCNGLRVDFRTTAVSEGGEYRTSARLPDVVEYGDVTLKRAVHAHGSAAVHRWLRSAANDWVNYGYSGRRMSPEDQTATVTVLDARYERVYGWTVKGVYPKAWSGPELDGGGGGVATETLVFSYSGFDGWV
jgi:phage tail-like protein